MIQAVQMLTSDLHMQTRSLAEWELIGTIVLQTCQHISFGLVGLLIPCALTFALQTTQVVALASSSLLQSMMKLTKAADRERMQCSILYYLLESVYYVDSTLRQVNGSTHFLTLLCDALTLCSSTGLGMLEVQLYMSAMEVVCIAGRMIGMLILHLMSEYEDLLTHATWNHQPTRKFDHPKFAKENTGQESDTSKEKLSSTRLGTQKPGVGCSKAGRV